MAIVGSSCENGTKIISSIKNWRAVWFKSDIKKTRDQASKIKSEKNSQRHKMDLKGARSHDSKYKNQ